MSEKSSRDSHKRFVNQHLEGMNDDQMLQVLIVVESALTGENPIAALQSAFPQLQPAAQNTTPTQINPVAIFNALDNIGAISERVDNMNFVLAAIREIDKIVTVATPAQSPVPTVDDLASWGDEFDYERKLASEIAEAQR